MRFFGQILAKILSTVIRNQQCEFKKVNTLVIRWIDPNLAEIKRTRIHCAHARPIFTAVFGSKNTAALAAQIVQRSKPAFITLHNRHNYFWIADTYRQSNATSLPRKTGLQFLPGRTAIVTLKNPANIFAAGYARTGCKTPRCSLPRVQRCVDDLRISWV